MDAPEDLVKCWPIDSGSLHEFIALLNIALNPLELNLDVIRVFGSMNPLQ